MISRRRSKSRTRSAGGRTPKPYIGTTPFDHSPQPFIPPPLAPSTAPQSPAPDSPPASSVGLPLGASSVTPPPDDPFGLGAGVASLSLGPPHSTAGSQAYRMHRPGFALAAPSAIGHPPPPSSAPALSQGGVFNSYFPPGAMGMGLSKKSSERGQQRPQMHTHLSNPYGYLAAPGPASAPPGPPPHMVGYPPYGGYQPYNPYGYHAPLGPAFAYPAPQIMPPMPAVPIMPAVPAGPPSAISDNMGMVVRAPTRLVRPKEDEQPPMRWEPGKDCKEPNYVTGNKGPYAPVLDPFTLGILNPKVELHPLLHPPGGGVYNMLFPPSAIHLSSDPPTKSWSNGRFSMATFPRVKRVRIVCRAHPWLMEVTNDSGVTVGDVCDKLYTEHQRHMSSSEWDAAIDFKRPMTKAYQWNRSTNPGAPGGVMGEGLRRIDWLMKNTFFGGLTEDRAFLDARVGNGLERSQPATFVLDVNDGPKKDED
ncbi:hypothetical protein AG1IA_02189 [Rhizoctonia solani AG-1 IA]|uniref:DUF6699 domain-containing protein n=1 Tax=Thanatephorus cucumeris (strain AG1-IA) TaxID=983506 RepID=L8X0F9_THACA|nr:hypothetical protein AG1IA_02189 [Rhizoctonia solani AG-1 IA]